MSNLFEVEFFYKLLLFRFFCAWRDRIYKNRIPNDSDLLLILHCLINCSIVYLANFLHGIRKKKKPIYVKIDADIENILYHPPILRKNNEFLWIFVANHLFMSKFLVIIYHYYLHIQYFVDLFISCCWWWQFPENYIQNFVAA